MMWDSLKELLSLRHIPYASNKQANIRLWIKVNAVDFVAAASLCRDQYCTSRFYWFLTNPAVLRVSSQLLLEVCQQGIFCTAPDRTRDFMEEID